LYTVLGWPRFPLSCEEFVQPAWHGEKNKLFPSSEHVGWNVDEVQEQELRQDGSGSVTLSVGQATKAAEKKARVVAIPTTTE